jgi:hypothetical protein
MSKIVQAINTMISNSDKIHEVFRVDNEGGNKEIYFLYNQYQWSMLFDQEDSQYYLYYYKQPLGPSQVRGGVDWKEVDFILYKSSDFVGREAAASFRDLYLLISEKVLGIDKVLDDILSESDDVPL